MEMLEVQIDLPRVLGIGREVMPGAGRCSAHGQDGTADLRRKMNNVIWIPRRIFNVLRGGGRVGVPTGCKAEHGSPNKPRFERLHLGTSCRLAADYQKCRES